MSPQWAATIRSIQEKRSFVKDICG